MHSFAQHLVTFGVFVTIAVTNSSVQAQAANQTPATEQKEKTKSDPVSARVEYAKTYLKLSQVELQQVLEANEKVPSTYPAAEIERRKLQVKVAELQLAALQKSGGRGDAVNVHLLQAKEQAILAKQRYLRALESKNRDILYTKLDLERLRLNAELAELRVKTWSDPKDVMELIDNVYWQIDILSDQLADLQSQVDSLKNR